VNLFTKSRVPPLTCGNNGSRSLTLFDTTAYTARALMTKDQHQDDAWSGLGTGWAIVSILIAGMLVVGGIGYLADLLAGTKHVFLGIGIVLGAVGGIYIVYLEYGKEDRDEG
jgi:ATP synthase protein I